MSPSVGSQQLELALPSTVLDPYVAAGVFGPFEQHLVKAMSRLRPGVDDDVLLALALAARAPSFGHVCADLADLDRQVALSSDAEGNAVALRWPSLERFSRSLRTSAIVATPKKASATPLRPLVWDGRRVYLQRYWRYETAVAEDLTARAGATSGEPGDGRIEAVLDKLFGAPEVAPDLQRLAASRALSCGISIIAGGPGTGKTHTIARILAAAHLVRNPGAPPLRIALAAPTGKAAARMGEAVSREVALLRSSGVVGDDIAEWLGDIEPMTVHRLLGRRDQTHFKHDRQDPLVHDLVVVDETSMVSLPLMARLLEAVRPDARLVLVGDPYQLASIEAGTVLGDLVGPARDRSDPQEGALAGRITVLQRMHRFGEESAIAAVAEAVRSGDADQTVDLLAGGGGEARWLRPGDPGVEEVLEVLVSAGAELVGSAQAGDGRRALEAASRIKVITATRHGPGGLYEWGESIEQGVFESVPGLSRARRWYVGRPIIVTGNDLMNGVFNGDVGVVVSHGGDADVALSDGEGVRRMSPSRLDAVETWWAMTIHKSQGSEFSHVVVSLPQAESPILTRELLYTAMTRAKDHLTVIGSEEAIRAAVSRPIARASGLRDRLWA
jgi:exodeoxyribonuclease V alpha subunit